MQRNIQTFFPSLPSPALENHSWPPPPPPPAPAPPVWPSSGRTDNSRVTKAVVATAVSSFAFCGLLFLAFLFFFVSRRRDEKVAQPAGKSSSRLQLQQSRASLRMRRSAFVDDDGLDALYWREFNRSVCHHCKKEYEHGDDHGGVASPQRSGRRIQEKPLLPAGFINSSSEKFDGRSSFSSKPTLFNQQLPPAQPNQGLPPPPGRVKPSPWLPPAAPPANSNTRPPAPPSPPPPPPPPPVTKSNAAPAPLPPPPLTKSKPGPPPPPPLPPVMKSNAAPAPPPPPPTTKPTAKPPPPPGPPPPRPNNKNPAPPPPPPGGNRPGGASSARPPPAPAPMSAAAASEGGPKKLKPLHWDKVNAINVEHSMVWDKITNGSFKVDEDIMEALFGTMATNKKAANNSGETSTSRAGGAATTTTAQVCLLDLHKSQNIAIVLRSTASRQDILDGLLEGRGLSTDILERLTKIAPTKDEEDLVRGYTGDPSKLADAESFLFHILRAVPAPFARLDAMLFRSTYAPEVAHLKQSLQTLELACKELKTPTRGLFLKLLETVLKAGNRMNAGTARGNAQAFNLTALRKLADVKSTDGSTTLLHFVVKEVVRSEGKRLVVNRNHSLRRSDSGAAGGSATLERTTSRSGAGREEREREYMVLGLPIVGGLSDEFANLKKAAGMDYDEMITTYPTLQARVAEIRRLLETCGGGGFAREMKTFVERAEEELKTARGVQVRVLELVKKTTEYYHPGASNSRDAHPLQLFMIVKDFLDMVDKACVDIARNLQKKKQSAAAARTSGSGSGSKSGSQSESASREASEKGRRPMARFPNLPPRFLSGNSKSDSSSDED